jgi:holo-[acyl-carrier protein] synthase
MAKALVTGFRDGLSLKHIIVTHDNYGRPEITYDGRTNDLLMSRNINSSYLSITDEKDYALACVVLEKVPS